MKLRFDADLEHQREAIAAITGVFEGQETPQDNYSQVSQSMGSGLLAGVKHSELGVANALNIDDSQILQNVQKIQEQNDITKSSALIDDHDSDYKFPNFTVEMETGTGKTYVYLRSMFELNRQCGFKKFIVVVPSVAIREGVLKSLEITREHFSAIYNKVPYDYFVYDSKKLGMVRQFATNNTIKIMIINIDAFRGEKNTRIFGQEREELAGRKPSEFVSATRPILIIDEPQSVDNTPISQTAIETLNPLCAFRYSATHKNFYNLLYKLDPVRAYDMRLVKRIEINSVQSEENFNMPYIRLDAVDYDEGTKTPHAKVTIHVDGPNGPKSKKTKIKYRQNLAEKSSRPDYAEGFIVKSISAKPGLEHIEFSNSTIVKLGEELGGMGEEIIKAQIRDTVELHLEREELFKKEGIKVLSLFFIDKVSNYRTYDNGTHQKGRFAKWFEEIYTELTNDQSAEKVHNGYFSQDSKGRSKDTSGATKTDEDTYNLIMRDKERLLNVNEPLRFIFSHSALKEGWDNPNVFQICTLRDIGTDRERRQTIGRGLRLPVNQEGERIFDDNINRLTVIANESFEDYAKALQADIEHDTGIQFGYIKPEAFSKLISPVTNEAIGQEKSRNIWEELEKQGYINAEGKIQDKFAPDSPEFVLDVADEFKTIRPAVIDEMKRYVFESRLENARKRKRVRYRKEVKTNPDFIELWKRISKKTYYSVKYRTDELINKAVEEIRGMAEIEAVQITRKITEANITRAGVKAEKVLDETTRDADAKKQIPDIMAFLQRETELTRGTLHEILLRSDRLKDFLCNPQAFMTEVAKRLNEVLHDIVIDGIKYEKIGDQAFEMRLFEEADEKHLGTYLDRLYKVQNQERTTHDYIVYESKVEKEFAEKLDSMNSIRFFVKLPSWFVVPTPVGNYNPDWAIVAEKDAKIYLVRETKGALEEERRRLIENQKIKCGARHFEAIDVDFAVCTNVRDAFKDVL